MFFFQQLSRCWSSPVIGCGRVTEYAKPPLQLKARGKSSGTLPLRISCVSTLMGPSQCFAACPPFLLSFISQIGYWLLAGSHYLSLKARSAQLACFVLLSLFLGFIVTFSLVSCALYLPETVVSISCSPFRRLVHVDFFFFNQAVAVLNTQAPATPLTRLHYIYLGYFGGRRGSFHKSSNTDRNNPWCLTWWEKEGEVEITHVSVRKGRWE